MGNTVKRRFDSWFNVLKQINIKNKDPKTGAGVQHLVCSREEVETIYAGDSEASKIVDIVPKEGLREWITFDNLDPEENDAVLAFLSSLKVKKKLEQAWQEARLYGGAVVLLSVSDGLDLDEPLNLNRIDSINALTVLSRYEIAPVDGTVITDLKSPNFGLPEFYYLTDTTKYELEDSSKIHHTRLIRFDGAKLPKGLFKQNMYWHDSVLSKLWDSLEGFANANNSLSGIITEFKQGILKIKDVADLLASGKLNDVINRLEAFDLGKTNYKTALLDSEEEYDIKTTPLSGVKDVMDKIEQRLVAASNIPATKLLGKSPSGGLSGKGESENRDFYDFIATEQEKVLAPVLKYLFDIIGVTNNSPGKGKDLSYKFNPLWQMDEKELAEIRKIIAETDEKYINTGVLTAAEVAGSRFGGDYTMETQLEEGLRDRNTSTANVEE